MTHSSHCDSAAVLADVVVGVDIVAAAVADIASAAVGVANAYFDVDWKANQGVVLSHYGLVASKEEAVVRFDAAELVGGKRTEGSLAPSLLVSSRGVATWDGSSRKRMGCDC